MKKLKEKKYVLLNIMSIVAFLLFWQGFSIYNQTAEIMNPKILARTDRGCTNGY